MRRVFVPLLLTVLALSVTAMGVQAGASRANPFPGIAAADQTGQAPGALHKASLSAATSGTYTDPVAAALAIGIRLVDLQSDVNEDNAGNGNPDSPPDGNDGGWDWIVTGQIHHANNGSYENLYGPIARGLVEAAIFTGNDRLARGAGDVFSGISRSGVGLLGTRYYRIWDADLGAAYIRWGDKTGNAALKDTIKTRHDVVLLGYGGAGGRSRTICLGRRGQGIPGLWPWDIHLLSNDSKALAAAFPGSAATYEAEVDSVAQVVMDDMNGLLGGGGWAPANFLQDYHQTGIAGALRIFDASQRTDDNALATAMRDTLVNGQLADGSWGVSYGGTFYGQDAQATAYAVLSLWEYAKRHDDAGARAAAYRGQLWLLDLVQAGGIVDDGGGEYPETAGEVAQALLAGDDVTPVPPVVCITPAHPCVQVPVNINRTDPAPMRGFSVTLALSGNLTLCGGGITQGTYLNSVSGTHYEVMSLGAGVYTVDCAILGAICGATGNGTLFTLNLASSSPGGTGTVTITSVTARDCNNASLPAHAGAPVSITIDQVAPGAIAGLTATQVRTGNPAGSTTGIQLAWAGVEPGASVEVWRAPYGSYPEYNDPPTPGSVPAAPVLYPPPAPWELTPVSLTGGIDYPTKAMVIPGSTHVRVNGGYIGPPSGWNDPVYTNFFYRFAGTVAGKNNHNIPAGPPAGDPTGGMDPNFSLARYFQMAPGSTVTVAGTFSPPLTPASFSVEGESGGATGQWLTIGLINQPWIAERAALGYNSYLHNSTAGNAKGRDVMVFSKTIAGTNVLTGMDDFPGDNGSNGSKVMTPSITSFSFQLRQGLDKTGAPVTPGGSMRYSVNGGPYTAWVNFTHDFVGLNTTLMIMAYTQGTTTAQPLDCTLGDLTADVRGPARDFWYYSAFVRDPCGNVSVASNRTGGTLNYHLGDVADGTGAGQDNLVNTADISMLGANYGVLLADPDPRAVLDVGPTTTNYIDGRPNTDNKVNFEDLMMFAINYGQVSAPGLPLADERTVAAADELLVDAPAAVAPGETFSVAVRFKGAGDIQGLSARLGWDAAVVEPVSVEAGELMAQQRGVVFSAEPGSVDAALLGAGRGIAGDGVLATVTFKALAGGAPRITVASVDARDTENRKVTLGSTAAPVVPQVTEFLPVAPNPFRGVTGLGFALAKAGPVELGIYSVSGRRVRTLVSGTREAGVYRLTWNGVDDSGSRVGSGVYFVRFVTTDARFTHTLVLIK